MGSGFGFSPACLGACIAGISCMARSRGGSGALGVTRAALADGRRWQRFTLSALLALSCCTHKCVHEEWPRLCLAVLYVSWGRDGEVCAGGRGGA